jgi:phenylacetate-CoA ligase
MDAPPLLELARWTTAAWEVHNAAFAPAALREAQVQSRLDVLVRTAAKRSPLYTELYKGRLGPRPVALASLPPISKRRLMDRFDDWCTDRRLTRATIGPHLNDPGRLGTPLLDNYQIWTSSGTSGVPGVFVHDAPAVAVYDALETVRLRGLRPDEWLAAACLWGDRYGLLAATGGHFAGCATAARLARINPWFARSARVFSILQPVTALARKLQRFGPTLIASYPTVAQVLADEQCAGYLHLRPRELWSGGEFLSPGVRAHIERAFGCRLRNTYGASEFMSIACDCACGVLHVNSDWVIVEPVDRHYQPVAPGVPSHTTLITNLANLVQPLIRYDIGDRVTWLTERCSCGNPWPAIHVEGRTDDILEFTNARGRRVSLLPLALSTALEEHAHVYGFQLVQKDNSTIELRLEPCAARQRRRVAACRIALAALLHANGLERVRIVWDERRPRRSASGKLRRIVAAAR